MVDRYASRTDGGARSWFDGMTGEITRIAPTFMVLLDGERLSMVFDRLDFVPLAPTSQVAIMKVWSDQG